jgi:hypothetical protein
VGRKGMGELCNSRPVNEGGVMSAQSPNLSEDERLVLFDLLARLIEDEKGARLLGLAQHDAEIWALNSLYCALERIGATPFSSDYRSAVAAARSRLLEIHGGRWPWRKAE